MGCFWKHLRSIYIQNLISLLKQQEKFAGAQGSNGKKGFGVTHFEPNQETYKYRAGFGEKSPYLLLSRNEIRGLLSIFTCWVQRGSLEGRSEGEEGWDECQLQWENYYPAWSHMTSHPTSTLQAGRSLPIHNAFWETDRLLSVDWPKASKIFKDGHKFMDMDFLWAPKSAISDHLLFLCRWVGSG